MKIRPILMAALAILLALGLSSCNLIGLIFGDLDPNPTASPSPSPGTGVFTVDITDYQSSIYAGQPIYISVNANSDQGNDDLEYQWHINGQQVANAWMPYAYLQAYSSTSKNFELMVMVREPDTNVTKSDMVTIYINANPYATILNNKNETITIVNFGDIMDDGANGYYTDWGGTDQLASDLYNADMVTIYNLPLNIRKKIRAGYFESASNQNVFYSGVAPTGYEANVEYLSTGLGVELTLNSASTSIYPKYSNGVYGGIDAVIGPAMDFPTASECLPETAGASFTPSIDFGTSDRDLDFDEPLALSAVVTPASGNYSYQWRVNGNDVVGATMPEVYYQGRTNSEQWVQVDLRVTDNNSGQTKNAGSLNLYQRPGASLFITNTSGYTLNVLNMGERLSGSNLHFTEWDGANMLAGTSLPSDQSAVVLHLPSQKYYKMRLGTDLANMVLRTDDYDIDVNNYDYIEIGSRNHFGVISGMQSSGSGFSVYGPALDYTLAPANLMPLVLEYAEENATFYVDPVPQVLNILSDQPASINGWARDSINTSELDSSGLWDYQWYVNREPIAGATDKYSYLKMRSSNSQTFFLGARITKPSTGETRYSEVEMSFETAGSLEVTNNSLYAIDSIYLMQWNTEPEPDEIQTFSPLWMSVAPGKTAYIYGLPYVYSVAPNNYPSYFEFQFKHDDGPWSLDRTSPADQEEADRALAGRRLTYSFTQWSPGYTAYGYLDHSGDAEVVIGPSADIPNSVQY